MKDVSSEEKTVTKRQKIYAAVSLAVVLILGGCLTWILWERFAAIGDTPEQFRDWLLSFGMLSRLVAVGVQFVQVVIALIPGELIEIAAGYAFGYIEGTLLVLGGCAAGSAAIFLLTKRFGLSFVRIFVKQESIARLGFLHNEKKLRRLVFVLYFIPGTPKDLLTYVVGLTPMSLGDFLMITLIARIPSVVSSTVGGHFIGDGNYLAAVIVFAVTGAVSLAGLFLYSKITDAKISTPKSESGNGTDVNKNGV